MRRAEPVHSASPLGDECPGFLLVVEPTTGRIASHHDGQAVSRHTGLAGDAVCFIDGDLLPRCGPEPIDRGTMASALSDEDILTLRGAHGGYAACAWRPQVKRLILLRDGIGRWPLYWSVSRHTPRRLVVGTSALAVAVNAGRHEHIRDAAADEYFKEGFIRPTWTVFHDVHPVPPGDLLAFDLAHDGSHDNPQPRSVRAPPGDGPLCTTSDPAVIHRELRAHLDEATRRIVWDAERTGVSVTLSGGIDSTLVAALARTRLDALKAVTLGSLVPLTPDEPWARYAAHRLSLPLTVARPHLGSMLRAFLQQQRHADQPLSPRILQVYGDVLANTGSSRVVLTGDCADGVFFGASNPEKWTRDDPERRPVVEFGPPLPEWLGSSGQDKASNHAVGHLLARQYRLGLTSRKIVRTPFTDWDVLSYARSMPFEFIFQPNRGKGPLKDQLTGWPRWFLERPKIGFAYQMRWAFLARGEIVQLRRLVSRETVDRFSMHLESGLRGDPARWGVPSMLRGFDRVLGLVEWTRLMRDVEDSRRFELWPRVFGPDSSMRSA